MEPVLLAKWPRRCAQRSGSCSCLNFKGVRTYAQHDKSIPVPSPSPSSPILAACVRLHVLRYHVWRLSELLDVQRDVGQWDRVLDFSFSLLAAVAVGIAGNFFDRAFRDGGVVDFLNFYFPFIPSRWFNPWPTFNVADTCICVGVGIYLVSTYVRPEPEKEEAES